MRQAEIKRETKETKISCRLVIDGTGQSEISTGVGFFDHMLSAFARHGLFDLELKATGDLVVDAHHTVEDCGIVLGQAIAAALGEKAGIKRYGSCILPMDEALVLASLDLGGRAYYQSDLAFPTEMIGEMATETIDEFFYALASNAQMNLHLRQLDGANAHHIAEATFKAFAKALDRATEIDERIEGVLSTKGSL